ncbi:MAG: hypothetical protein KIS94_01290 [Chitinophagales bacterium]|nr:hypothetical protein [Chitinophagales bacterium]
MAFIAKQQNERGGFPSYELYPVVKPDEDWSVIPDDSPFITANILCSLLQVNNEKAQQIIRKGTTYLSALMEYGGYWRFWPLHSKQHPVPIDLDDTAVASYVLTKAGYTLNNREILLSNKNDSAYFETWLKPNWQLLFKSPLLNLKLLHNYYATQVTVNMGDFDFSDHEPAVAANVLLYLGEAENKECISRIIDEIKNGNEPLQFYPDAIMLYYHIARAYAGGITSFIELKDTIAERLLKRFTGNLNENDTLLYLMAANILLDFKTAVSLAGKLIDYVALGSMYPDKWQCLPYFCSKNRNFLVGSPAFTAALFAEAYTKLNAAKS